MKVKVSATLSRVLMRLFLYFEQSLYIRVVCDVSSVELGSIISNLWRCEIHMTANGNEQRSGDEHSPDGGSARELGEFCAGATLTLLLPTLMYCATIGRLWPLSAMVCKDALGIMVGLVMYRNRKSSSSFIPCVPVARLRALPRSARTDELKKAA